MSFFPFDNAEDAERYREEAGRTEIRILGEFADRPMDEDDRQYHYEVRSAVRDAITIPVENLSRNREELRNRLKQAATEVFINDPQTGLKKAIRVALGQTRFQHKFGVRSDTPGTNQRGKASFKRSYIFQRTPAGAMNIAQATRGDALSYLGQEIPG